VGEISRRGKTFQKNLLAHDFDNDAFFAAAVELGVIDFLPGAEVEAAGGDGDDDLMVDEEALQVGVAVGFAGAVVSVVLAEGGKMFQPLVDVGEQAILGIVDPDASGDVHGRDEDHALGDAAFGERGFHLGRDAEEFAQFCGGEGEVFSVCFHG
jgi:hypothetical protein